MRYLYASLAAAALASAAVPAFAGTLLVPQQFPTIQKAVNAAKPYDTVLVSAKPKGGVYNEAVTITTPNIVLQGLGNPVLDGTGLAVSVPNPYNPAFPTITYPNGIEVRASHVSVRGLTVQNTGSGDYFDGSSAINAGYSAPDGSAYYNFSDIEISGVTLKNDNTGITITGMGPRAADGTITNPAGYRVIGCVATGNFKNGATFSGVSDIVITGNKFTSNSQIGLSLGGFLGGVSSALVTGNQFKNNTSDGADIYGTGLLVTANESALNGTDGLLVNTAPFSFGPAPTTAPAPSAVALNSVHDNGSYGLYAQGAQTISGNSFSKNSGAGIVLEGADGSAILGNVISGTVLASGNSGDGAGIFADFPTTPSGGDSKLKISFNQISGDAGDGIYINGYAGGVISLNNVVKNQGVGIHLSDITHYYSSNGYTAAPTIVTQNVAVHNAVFDARDDASAPDSLTDSNGQYYNGDGATTLNVWAKNVFGKTDPAGLSK